jgi:hypothetical protein
MSSFSNSTFAKKLNNLSLDNQTIFFDTYVKYSDNAEKYITNVSTLDPNYCHNSLINSAITEGLVDSVKLLLKNKNFDPNLNKNRTKNYGSDLCIYMAIRHNQMKILELLINDSRFAFNDDFVTYAKELKLDNAVKILLSSNSNY